MRLPHDWPVDDGYVIICQMRLPQVLLTAVLSLGICLQGFAGIRVDAPCPMMQGDYSMATMSTEDMTDMMSQMDCLTDVQPHDDEQPGKHCPAGMNCLSTVAAFPTVFRAPVSLRIALPGLPDPVHNFQSYSSLLLWRPPALI